MNNITDISALYLGLGIVAWFVVGGALIVREQLASAAILAVFFFMPAMVSILFGGKSIPTGQLLLLFFSPILIMIYSKRRIPVEPARIAPVILYIVSVIITITWNGIPLWENKSSILPMFFAILIYLSIFDIRSLKFLLIVFLLFVVISTFVAGLQYAGYSQFYLATSESSSDAGGFVRGVGLAQHFSQTGLYCAAALPISFMGFVTAKTRRARMLWLIPGLFAVAGMTFTVLRAAFIGGAFGVLVSLWYWNKRKIIPYMAISILLILLMVVIVPVLRSSAMALFVHTTTIDSSAMNRPLLIKKAIDIWYEYPVFGGGPRIFTRTTHHVGDAHNTYFNTLVEYGLLGLILFTAVLYYSFKDLHRTIKHSSDHRSLAIGLIGSLAAACMVGLVHSFNYISMFWLFPALGLSMGKVYAITKSQNKS